MKKISLVLPVLLIFTLSLMIAGCGGGGGGGGSDPLDTDPTPTIPIIPTIPSTGSADGSYSSPLNLGIAPFSYPSGKVGEWYDSYYMFKTGPDASSAGSYVISLTQANVSIEWDLHLGSATGTRLKNCDNNSSAVGDEVCETPNLDPDTTYVLEVTNWSSFNGTYALSITKGISQGSAAVPYVLLVDSPYSTGTEKLGYSYYTFTTSAAGSYLISSNQTGTPVDLGWELYSDAAFQTLITGYDCNMLYHLSPVQQNIACAAPNLPAGTYYLKVTNPHPYDQAHYTITISTEAAGNYINAPLALSLDTHYTGTIYDNGYKYFSFTAPSSGTYMISSTSDHDVSWDLYSDATFSTLVKSCSYGSSTYGMTKCLTPNIIHGVHYLRMKNNVQQASQYSDLIITSEGSEGAIGDPVLLTSRTPYSGRVAAGGTSYYSFQTESLSAAAPYLVSIDGVSAYVWVTWKIYTDAAFTTQLAQCSSTTFDYNSIVCATNESSQTLLQPGTTYYLAIQLGTSSSTLPYTVTLSPHSAAVGCSAGGTCYNFEGGTLAGFTGLWSVSTLNSAGSGTYNVQSGISNKNVTSSCFQISATDAKWVSFSVNTQFTGTDSLVLYVDYGLVKAWTGSVPWERFVYRPSAGGMSTRLYQWCHEKPDTGYIENKVWIDDIEFNY